MLQNSLDFAASESRPSAKNRKKLKELAIVVLLQGTILALAFFPQLFLGKSFLPADMANTMTLPFSQQYSHPDAYNTYIGDAYFQTFPLEYYTQLAYHRGSFVFWNPLVVGGYPQYLEGMWVYNFPLLLFSAWAAMKVILLLPLLVAGIGFYFLVRSYGVRSSISHLFASAYMLNSMHVTYLFAHFIPAAFSLVPFVILYLKKYADSENRNYILVAGIFTALSFCAGMVQTVSYVIFCVLIFWAGHLWPRKPVRPWRAIRAPLTVILIGLGLSAAFLVPSWEIFHVSRESGDFYSTSLYRPYDLTQRGLSVLLSATFFIPQLIGSIRGIPLTNLAGVFTIDFQGAIGFLPLLFAVWGGWYMWKRAPQVRPFVLMAVLGIGLPILTPLFRFLYFRFLIVYIFGACALGAVAMEYALSHEAARSSLTKWAKSALVVLSAMTVVLLAVAITLRLYHAQAIAYLTSHFLTRLTTSAFAEGNLEWTLGRIRNTLAYWEFRDWSLPAALVSVFLCLLMLYRYGKNRLTANSFLLIATALTIFQLMQFVYLWIPRTDLKQYPAYRPTEETRILQADSTGYRTFVYRYNIKDRQYQFVNNQNVVYNYAEVSGYESVVPRSFYLKLQVWSTPQHVRANFLGLLNIRHIVTNGVDLKDSNLTLVDSTTVRIYKNKRVRPRQYLAYRSRIFSNDSEVVHAMLLDSASAEEVRFLPTEEAPHIASTKFSGDSVGLRPGAPEHLAYDVFTHDTAYLVSTDTHYPGWRTTLDGLPVALHRANYAMRAVMVPPGKHVVRMDFEPESFRIGLYISIATASLCAVLFLSGYSRKRRE